MARTVVQMYCRDIQWANQTIANILMSKNYQPIIENGERVFKCGVGFWTAMKYVKVEFAENNTVILSGWIRPVMCGEQDLNGVFGALPKKQVLKVFQEIQNALMY